MKIFLINVFLFMIYGSCGYVFGVLVENRRMIEKLDEIIEKTEKKND